VSRDDIGKADAGDSSLDKGKIPPNDIYVVLKKFYYKSPDICSSPSSVLDDSASIAPFAKLNVELKTFFEPERCTATRLRRHFGALTSRSVFKCGNDCFRHCGQCHRLVNLKDFDKKTKSETTGTVFFWEMRPNNSKNQRRQIIDVYRQNREPLRESICRKHTRATSASSSGPSTTTASTKASPTIATKTQSAPAPGMVQTAQTPAMFATMNVTPVVHPAGMNPTVMGSTAVVNSNSTTINSNSVVSTTVMGHSPSLGRPIFMNQPATTMMAYPNMQMVHIPTNGIALPSNNMYTLPQGSNGSQAMVMTGQQTYISGLNGYKPQDLNQQMGMGNQQMGMGGATFTKFPITHNGQI
jgi:hypothetical protein